MSNTATLLRTAACAAISLVALAGSALADGEPGLKDAPVETGRQFTYAITIGGTSDYVFRGISQSDEDPAFQAAVDISYGILYAGIWGSGIDFGDTVDENAEIDLYAGIKPVWVAPIWGPVTFDLGAIYYWYPGTTDDPELDYVEVKAGYSVASPWIKNLTTGTTVYWTPDNTGETGEVVTVETAAAYALPQMWLFTPTISGVFGTAYAEDRIFDNFTEDQYTYWNAGIALSVEKFTFDFRYWDTDMSEAACNGPVFQCDERFVFSAKVVLP